MVDGVVSQRARLAGPHIHYRMVGEHEGGTLEGEPARESTGPVTLGELYDFLTSA